MHVKAFVCLLCLLGALCGQAQVFRHFTEKEGAALTPTLDITQDREGYMWFATVNGLYRYDSRSFRRYEQTGENGEDVMTINITSLKVDSEGRFWVGTTKGLFLYDRERDTFIGLREDSTTANSFKDEYIWAVFEDSQKRLWAGTTDGLGLITMEKGEVRIVKKLSPEFTGHSNIIRSIAEGQDGTLWLGTYDGLIRYRGEKDTRLFRRNSEKQDVLLNQYVAICGDRKGGIWLGSNREGLVWFDEATETFRTVDSFRDPNGDLPIVNKILPDGNGRYWMGTESGLARYDPSEKSSRWYVNDPSNPNSLIDNTLYSMYIDREGGIWMGSYYMGISYFHPQMPVFSKWLPDGAPFQQFPVYSAGVSRNGNKWALRKDKSEIFVTDGRKVEVYHLTLPSSDLYHYFLLEDPAILWCGGGTKLSRINLKTGTVTLFPYKMKNVGNANWRSASGIMSDHSGAIWSWGSFGLMRLGKGNHTTEQVLTVPGKILTVLEDSQHRLWAGGDGGELFLLAGNGTLIDSTRMNAPVSGLAETPDGTIWLVQNGDLYRHIPGNGYLRFEKELENGFEGVMADLKGNLWLINGRTRLIKYNPEKKQIQNLSYQEGLPSNSVFISSASFMDQEGALFFLVNNNELLRLMLQADHDIEAPLTVVLSMLRLFNKQVKTGDASGILTKPLEQTPTLTFRHDQNVFSLDFALLSYYKSNAKRYAYKLEGFDKNWNEVEIPSATYTSLPPGTYTLLVKAANGDGAWTPDPLKTQIVILPPWWKTWTAYLFYLLLTGLLVYSVARFFWLRASFRKENELYEAKLDFFTNISHEIRTHLTLVSGPLEKAFSQDIKDETLKSYLRFSRNNSHKLMQLVTELLDFRKIQKKQAVLQVAAYDVVKVVKSVMASFEYLSREKKIRSVVECPEEPVTLWFDLLQIQKVLYNLLGNAYKFTPDGGTVSVVIKKISNEVTISVNDTGIGIAPEHLGRLFENFFQSNRSSNAVGGHGIGLALSKAIVELHGGCLTVSSRQSTPTTPGHTSFTLRLLRGWTQYERAQMVEPVAPLETSGTPRVQEVVQAEKRENSEKKRTLLLIEDNDDLRTFLSGVFSENYRVLATADGEEGLKMARERIPDLVICDVMLPGKSGFDVCQSLKSSVESSHIPVVLLTAMSANQQIKEGLKTGADDYLVKPFDPGLLQLKVGNLIETREKLRRRYLKAALSEGEPIDDSDPDRDFLEKLRNLVAENLSEPDFGVPDMARHVGVSTSILYKKLRALTGTTVNEFIRMIRMKRAEELLESGRYNVNEVAIAVGYNDSRYFSREFRKIIGKYPGNVRKLAKEG